MLQNDASQTGPAPEARNDLDILAQCELGPATGNAITGVGTVSGSAGADTASAGAMIVAVNGVESAGGTITVEGQYGTLVIQSDGSYTYTRGANAPDGVSDVFTYTLADAGGARDTATLTIDIRCQEDSEEAQNQVVTADGVVMLPAGVELSDIRVVGRDLVITLPDGSTITVPNGAVFVPQIVIGDVEVPPTNIAALLIEQEPQPASGTPESSGGNFAVDVPPLDPGVPLGDLLPPTDFGFTPPVFEEVGQVVDEDPDIVIQPDGQPATSAAEDEVDEAGLPPRGLEPAGSSQGSSSETTTGVIIVDAPDDPYTVTITDADGNVHVVVEGLVIEGEHGELTITEVDGDVISYSYTLADNADHDGGDIDEDFSVTVTDNDGDTDTATLHIDIIDDVPTAVDDSDSIAAGAFGPATGNVITDADAGDEGDSDDGADTQGADGAELTAVTGAGDTDVNEDGDFVVEGEYGVLTISEDGSYSYVRNAGTPGGVTDTFTYTLTDGDGDTDTATLTIDIGDLDVEVGDNPAVLLDDDALAGGNPGTPEVGDDADSVNATGTLSGSGGDGDLAFELQTDGAPEGFTYVEGPDGSVLVQQDGVTVLTVTVDAETGDYTVTQNAPIDHPEGGEENNLSFTIGYTVTDADGDSDSGSLTINVDDDTPVITRTGSTAPTIVVDETVLAVNASGDFSGLFGVSYGADGAGTTEFELRVVNGSESGLVDVATGEDILLFNNDGVIEGRVGGADGAVAFTVSVDSETGVVTLDQVRAVTHPDATNPDDQVSPANSAIQLTVTATDADGDPVSETINIGGNLAFDDDGPSVPTVSTEGFSISHDETPGVDGDADDVAGALAVFDGVDNPGNDPHVAGAVIGYAVSTGAISVAAGADFGADGPGTTTFALAVSAQGVDSGLDLTDGTSIFLFLEDGIVVGRAGTNAADAADNPAAFALAIDADTGVVSMVQYLSIEHPNPANPDEPITIANGAVLATATITDGDNDPATGQVAIGGLISFQDDAPDTPTVSTQGFSISHDETPGDDADAGDIAGSLDVFDGVDNPGNDPDVAGTVIGYAVSSGAISVAAGGDFGADGPGTVTTFALAVSQQGVDSGLDLTDGTSIFLFLEDGIVVGRAGTNAADAADNPAAFALAIDSDTGVVSMVQYLSIEHPTGGSSHDEPITIANGAVLATATVTDGDNDPATGSVGIGGLISFQDDGPDARTASVATDTLVVDESRPEGTDTDGASLPMGDAIDQADFSDNFVTTIDYGADGPAGTDDVTYSLVLNGEDVPSGLYALDPTDTVDDADGIGQGAQIVLNQDGNTITGSVGDVDYFTITIDAETGIVTFTQLRPIWHPTPGTSYDEAAELNTAVASALQVVQTVTDGDGDTDSAAINIGRGIFSIQDDGPVANPDRDTVTGAGGTATGNVITDAHAGDLNDGDTGADDVGEDAPGRISFISSSEDSDTVPAGGSVTIDGEFGTLQIFSNGNYVYTRDDGLGGGETETFTYTLIDADGDTITSTLEIVIDDLTPVATTASAAVDDDGLAGANTAAGANDINANTFPDPNDLDGDLSTERTFRGMLGVEGGDGDIDFSLIAPAGSVDVGQETVTFSFIAGVLTATIATSPDPDRVGDALFEVSLDADTGEYTVTLRDNILHDADSADDEDGTEISVDIPYQVSDADGDDSDANGTLTIVFNDDVPVLSNVAAGAGVSLDETTAGDPDGFPISDTSDTAAITATSAFGADGPALLGATVYGLAITGGPLTTLRTAVGDHLITLVQVDANTIEGQYNGDNVAFTIDIDSNGFVTLTQEVALEHVVDGSSAAAHDDPLDLDGLVDATITITDADGDSTSGSAAIGDGLVFRDDGPDAQLSGQVAGGITLDETRPVGDDTDGGAAPAGDNQATADFSVAFVEDPNVDYGADGAGSVGYTLLLSGGPNVLSGLYALDPSDTVDDADGIGQGAQIVLNQTNSTTITGTVGTTTYFTITIDPETGVVTFTQMNNIWHDTAGSSAAALDDPEALNAPSASSIQVVQRVTDADGDFDTAAVNVGRGVFVIQDDGPEITTPAEDSVLDPNTLTASGDFEFDIGTDSFPTGTSPATYLDVDLSGTVDGSTITVTQQPTFDRMDGDLAIYEFTFTYDSDPGPGVITASNSGEIAFNLVDGGYTVTLDDGFESTTVIPVSDVIDRTGYNLTGSSPSQFEVVVSELDTPDPLFVQFSSIKGPSNDSFSSGGDATFGEGEILAGPQSWVSITNTENGVAGDTIQSTDILDFDLFTFDPGSDTSAVPDANAEGLVLDLAKLQTGEDFVVILKLVSASDPSDVTTRAIIVNYDDVYTEGEALPAGYTMFGTPGNDEGLVIIESNDFNAPNEDYVIVGAQLVMSTQNIEGEGIVLNGDVGVGGASTTTQEFGETDTATTDATVDQDVIKIVDIGLIKTVTSTQDVQLTFDVTVRDADGDTATDTFVVNPTTTTSTLATTSTNSKGPAVQESLLANDNFEQLLKSVNAANSNTVFLGAIAAAGISAAPAVAHDGFAGRLAEFATDGGAMPISLDFGSAAASVDAAAAPAITGKSTVAVQDAEAPSSGSSQSGQAPAEASVAGSDSGADAAPVALPGGTDAPVVSHMAEIASTAMSVAMPSAEMLAGISAEASVDAGKASTSEVSRVLADALAGGADGPNLDALLQAATGHGPALSPEAAAEALAAHLAAVVPTWDMGAFGGFTAGHPSFTMDQMMAHPDAAPQSAA